MHARNISCIQNCVSIVPVCAHSQVRKYLNTQLNKPSVLKIYQVDRHYSGKLNK